MKRILFSLIAVGILLCTLPSAAQPFFHRYDSIPVKLNGVVIKFPWAGGLNFIQASNIDLNGDGIKDLFIFDRTGNKIRTFINNGTPGAADYTYAPQWENFFPNLHDWALLVDYNCDNKEDIFSFSDAQGGIKVYKNISTTQFGLQFELVDTLIHSVYNPDSPSTVACSPGSSFQCNLYVSSVDVPAIADIDNDGDIDIITFAVNGACLEYHQNQSEENYGSCDSLKFQMRNRGWGFGSESPTSNVFIIDDTCANNVLNPGIAVNHNEESDRSADRHSGNCELCMDMDGDGDKDILIGNIYYNNLNMITNGGTPLQSHFISNDLNFPFNNGGSPPVDLTLMPCGYKVDVNNDGVSDLILSPEGYGNAENFKSVWYYKNTGTTSITVFQLQQHNFLQDNMIDVGQGAYPAFFDYDQDGLPDMFVSNDNYFDTTNHGYQIAQFHNIGTATHPMYDLVTRDYNLMSFIIDSLTHLALDNHNMIPAFGDLDGDGDADLVVGEEQGRIHYFENIAPIGSTAQFVLREYYLQNTLNRNIDVGFSAAPQIIDMDGDGKKDLIIGSKNGKLMYLHHTGTGTEPIPLLDSITSSFGNVNVCPPAYNVGYSCPAVFKQGGVTKMLVGSVDGHVHLYDNIDGNLNGVFNQEDQQYLGIFQGTRTAPCVMDVNNDGLLDMALGNYEGGVTFYIGTSTLNSINDISTKFTWTFNVFPNPADNNLTFKMNNDNIAYGYSIDIVNLMGQVITSEKITSSTFTLNTQNLGPGMYICKVSETDKDGNIKSGTLIKKVVIQH